MLCGWASGMEVEIDFDVMFGAESFDGEIAWMCRAGSV